MRVVTYVEGTLTVINGDDYYSEEITKPDFISGTNFYYEPTLKQMDGIELTDAQINDAEAFIDNFEFPANVEPEVVDNSVHCVDADGNYIGYIENDGTYQEVPSAPTKSTEKWNGTEWVDSVLIDKTTKMYMGIGDTRTSTNTEYAPNTLVPGPFDIYKYFWDGTAWNISLEDAKFCKNSEIRGAQKKDVNGTLGEPGFWEPASYIIQNTEARAWKKDNSTDTPFIDILLNARNLGETKQELVDKIIKKSDFYKNFYASSLGKFHYLMTQIENATTIDEVKAISWEINSN